jgi:hypothetical protein
MKKIAFTINSSLMVPWILHHVTQNLFLQIRQKPKFEQYINCKKKFKLTNHESFLIHDQMQLFTFPSLSPFRRDYGFHAWGPMPHAHLLHKQPC